MHFHVPLGLWVLSQVQSSILATFAQFLSSPCSNKLKQATQLGMKRRLQLVVIGQNR